MLKTQEEIVSYDLFTRYTDWSHVNMHIPCPLLFGQSQELVWVPLPTEIISIYFYSWLLFCECATVLTFSPEWASAHIYSPIEDWTELDLTSSSIAQPHRWRGFKTTGLNIYGVIMVLLGKKKPTLEMCQQYNCGR